MEAWSGPLLHYEFEGFSISPNSSIADGFIYLERNGVHVSIPEYHRATDWINRTRGGEAIDTPVIIKLMGKRINEELRKRALDPLEPPVHSQQTMTIDDQKFEDMVETLVELDRAFHKLGEDQPWRVTKYFKAATAILEDGLFAGLHGEIDGYVEGERVCPHAIRVNSGGRLDFYLRTTDHSYPNTGGVSIEDTVFVIGGGALSEYLDPAIEEKLTDLTRHIYSDPEATLGKFSHELWMKVTGKQALIDHANKLLTVGGAILSSVKSEEAAQAREDFYTARPDYGIF